MGAAMVQEWPIVASLRGERENKPFGPLQLYLLSTHCQGLLNRFHVLPNNSEDELGDLQEPGSSPKPVTLAWLCNREQTTTHSEPQISSL